MIVTDKQLEKSNRQNDIRTIHIDTSLQIERCKTYKKAQVVEQALKTFHFKSTSSYAKLEFKRAWLQRLLYIYSASQKVNQVNELIGYVNDKLGSHPGHLRKLTTCIQAIVSFLSKINGKLSLTDAARLIRLQSHIQYAIITAYTWWDLSITHEYNGTGYVRASEQPKQLSGGKIDVSIPQCKQNKIKCAIHQFFKSNREHFDAIKVAIEKLGNRASNELKVAKDVIEKAEKNPKCLCYDRNCLKLGDILIAIDGLAMDCFAANNDKEWALLSEVLGKPLVNPVQEAKTAS